MYPLIRKLLFRVAPEQVHHQTMSALSLLTGTPGLRQLIGALFGYRKDDLAVNLWGIRFPNPVGLAAGFDKDGKYTDVLDALGFGFIEIGTVTPRPQPGNEAPRLFRLPDDKALINRMGFNNDGVQAAAERLRHRKGRTIIGGNIGKNKNTANEDAVNDYETCFEALYDVVDYFVVNVSSPNTPGLRELQEKEPLKQLLHRLQGLNRAKPKPRPMLLKIAPDLTERQLDDILEIVSETGIDGIVATNTTIDRHQLRTPHEALTKIGAGGLSGLPLRRRATEVIRYLHTRSQGKIPLIAVGGVFTAEDAREKLDAGASLVQVYTGFIYEGPGIVKSICSGLSKK